MVTRQKRGQRTGGSKPPAEKAAATKTPPPTIPRPTAYQRYRLKLFVLLLVGWFCFLVYVAFFSS